MTYRVQSINRQYAIIEKDTQLEVFHVEGESTARELCRSLNLGGGFNGYTPSFFTLEFKQKERPPTE